MVLTLGLPVPTSTESDATAAERGDASRIACVRRRVRDQPQKWADRDGSSREPSLLSLHYWDRRCDDNDSLVR